MEAEANSTGLEQFMMGSLGVVVKRGRMYEDAFNALTKEKGLERIMERLDIHK